MDINLINVKRKILSDLFNCSENYINELHTLGMPKNGYDSYPLIDCLKWKRVYDEDLHQKELARAKSEKPQDDLARKSARLKELEIMEREGRLIDYDINKQAWLNEYKMLGDKLDMFGITITSIMIQRFPELGKYEKDIRDLVDEEKNKIKDSIAKLPIIEPEQD